MAALASLPACSSQEGSDEEEGGEGALTMGTGKWDQAAEAEWSSFISAIGEARAAGKCTTVNKCINDGSINKLHAAGDPAYDIFADCADLPMELRAYFAMKTNRPFRYVAEVQGQAPANLQPGATPDWRYTSGNHPTEFSTARASNSIQSLMSRISGVVHSGFFRLAPEVEDGDTYPIDIKPGTVRPGTVYYDPNGHVLVVYRVDADGTVRFIDGHPDNSLTHTILDDRLAVGGRAQGGGFRNFRPILANGDVYTFATNAQLPDFSDKQYGRGHAYYDWVRSQLSGGQALDPKAQFDRLTDQLCTDAKTRVDAVAAGVHLASGPMGELPPNIYGADGDWEAFSTPGRDQKLRASFKGMINYINESMGKVQARDASVAWNKTPGALAQAYRDSWSAKTRACQITYTGSTGQPVTITLADLQSRLFDLSFDPYQCVEMRWGAYPSRSAEFQSCNTNDPDHIARFQEEATLRNIIDRPPAGTATPPGFGPQRHDDVDVGALLGRLAR